MKNFETRASTIFWQLPSKAGGVRRASSRLDLKKFGYYPSDATLTSSDFDDHLELALKAYQKFYRLNVTGNLDSSTTQQMMIPRCGVPDIINLLHLQSRAVLNQNKEVPHGCSLCVRSNKWPPSKYALTYTFGRVSKCFSKWAEVTSFTFTEAADGASADIRRSWDGSCFFPQAGRLHYDADENWSTDPAMDQIDLESVSVHEIGHLLGLYHSTDANPLCIHRYKLERRKEISPRMILMGYMLSIPINQLCNNSAINYKLH
uniref:Peptidase metallopeptidase domain-containing protein n=1 Tax=Salix viminalis TaxID=40686 RepID=A0A6N2N2B7_SALVM